MDKIFIPRKGNTTTTMIFVKTGSRKESDNIKGVSHFLEHLMFKGTKTRTAKQIAYEIDKYGAMFNAFTDYEMTAYWIRSHNKYKDKALEILLDMLNNSKFPSVEIKKEREVILQEMKMYEDSPRDLIDELFYKNLFNKQSGLHLPIIGTRKSLKNITRKELLNYYKEYYKNLILVQVGDVDPVHVVHYDWANIILPPQQGLLCGRNNTIIKKEGISQANVIIGNYIEPNERDRLDNIFSFKLLAGVLSDMSGRLFSTVREKYNLVYRIHFGFQPLSCGSIVWEVSLGLNADKIEKAYDLIMKELTRPITQKEIQYALTKKIGETAIINDSDYNMAQKIAYNTIYGVDYHEAIFNYERGFKKASKNLNQFVNSIKFKNNLIVQLIPKNVK